MPEYDFGWIRDEAKHHRYGTIDLQLKIHNGQIVLVTVTGSKKQRSLQDTQKDKEGSIE